MKQAYYVEALWGQDDEGNYATFIWAENPVKACEGCIAEMNDVYNVDDVYNVEIDDCEDYEIVECILLEHWIALMEATTQDARFFIQEGPSIQDARFIQGG